MKTDIFNSKSLSNIMKIHPSKRKRVSSYNRRGTNIDFYIIKPGEKKIIFDVDGPGCITHIWTTQLTYFAPFYPRHVIIRIWWDDEEKPSVECPLGDFFGLGHGEIIPFNSMPLQMSPEKGKGMNCWWPMPFKKHAKIEIENDNHKGKVINPEKIPKIMDGLYFYYYVDYEIYDKWEVNDNLPTGYFHCQFRRVDYRKDVKRGFQTKKKFNFFSWQANGGCNTRENGGYDRNHILLEGEGKGQYVGCHIDIDNKFRIHSFVPGFNWPGEGDDMIFIDKDCEEGEPTLYGTGTEDYVNTAYCPTQKYDGLYHGVIKGDWRPWGKLSYYRYHILDPIPFKEKIKVTIEHGHNNLRGDIWETTAYWYQLEPHKKFPDFPSYEKRMPRRNFLKKIYTITRKLLKWFSFGAFLYLLIEFIFPLI